MSYSSVSNIKTVGSTQVDGGQNSLNGIPLTVLAMLDALISVVKRSVRGLSIISLVLITSGCSTQQINRFVCTGAGTCSADGGYARSTPYVSPLPQTIITSAGNYQITTNQSTGQIQSVIKVSGGK